ncbi:hypothetical protein SDC9_197971 [bioreactor metagenome]|uniref:Uncharacterized protein n=1 Tax=bioreactor metagenome TaxID=1076179 RepID=A0A645IGD8_9ZZZZ
MYREITVVAVEFAGKEADQLGLVHVRGKFRPCSVRFGEETAVLGGKLRNGEEIVKLAFEFVKRLKDVFERADGLNGRLRFFLVVPEIGTRHDLFDPCKLFFAFLDLQKPGKMLKSFQSFLSPGFDFINSHVKFLW